MTHVLYNFPTAKPTMTETISPNTIPESNPEFTHQTVLLNEPVASLLNVKTVGENNLESTQEHSVIAFL